MKNCPTCQKTYPDDFGLCPRDGEALGKKGLWVGAIAEYREAIRLKPDDAEAHNSLGRALEHKSDRQAALDEYRKAYDLDPKNATFQGDYERLLKELNK